MQERSQVHHENKDRWAEILKTECCDVMHSIAMLDAPINAYKTPSCIEISCQIPIKNWL